MKEAKVVLLSREEPVQTAKCATAHKDAELPHKASKHGAKLTKTCKVIKIRKKLKTEVLVRKLQPFKGYYRQPATELPMNVQAANAVHRASCGSLNSSRFKARAAGKVVSAKLREADLKDSDNCYPALQLLITKRCEDGFQTITMKARCKDEIVPPEYWNFVHGHPGGNKQTRPLLPFEDNQYRLLHTVVKKVRVLQSSRVGKPGFATTKNEVTELQVLIGQYLTGCKIVKGLQPSRFATSLKAEKEEKLLKGHVLAKCNNISARCVVVGDPAIRIDEISVPIDLADYDHS